MNITSKINNVIILTLINIILLGGYLLYFLTEYIYIPDIEIYILSILLFTVFSIRNQYEKNMIIQQKTKTILLVFVIFFCILTIEYSLSPHLTMAVNQDYILDTSLAPKGYTIEEFEKEYLEYIEKFPEYNNAFMYLIHVIISTFRFIFYIILSVFFIYPSYTTRFITSRVFSRKHISQLKEVLLILPILTPTIIGIIMIFNLTLLIIYINSLP